MAVDTRDERANGLGFLNVTAPHWPVADGASAGGDRLQVLHAWRGATPSSAAVVTGGGWRLALVDPLQFTLKLFTPLPERRPLPVELVLDPRRTDLTWSTALPGGYATLRAGVAADPTRPPTYGYLPRPIVDLPRAHVELYHGMVLVWEGTLVEVEYLGGEVRGLLAEGYGVVATLDDWYDSASVTTATSGAILQAVVAGAAPLLRVGNRHEFVDPQVQHQYADFDNLTPADALELVANEGTVAAARLDWAVWGGRVLWLQPRVEPATPDFRVALDARVRRRRNYRPMASEVAVNYDAAGTDTTTSRATNAQWRHGFARRLLLTGGRMTATGAEQLRQTELSRRAEPQEAIAITRAGGRGLERPGGSEVAPFLVRADFRWVQLGHEGLVVPIVETEYSASEGELRVTCDTPLPTFVALVRETRRVATAVKRRINPTAGGRERW